MEGDELSVDVLARRVALTIVGRAAAFAADDMIGLTMVVVLAEEGEE